MFRFAFATLKCPAPSRGIRLSLPSRHYSSARAVKSRPDIQHVQGSSRSNLPENKEYKRQDSKIQGVKTSQKATPKKEEPIWEFVDHERSTRFGMVQFLGLREMKNPPGMEYDPVTKSFSFSKRLYTESIYDHQLTIPGFTVPYLVKSLTTRGDAWALLKSYDQRRLRLAGKIFNSTNKRHRGQCLSTVKNTFDLIQRAERPKRTRALLWHNNIGPSMEKTGPLLDDFLPEDVAVTMETVGTTPRLSLVFVSINVSFKLAQDAWIALSSRREPKPGLDVFTPVVTRFCEWFTHTIAYQKTGSKEPKGNNEATLPMLRDIIDNGSGDFPVVFAFRDQYIWFMWKGGLEGKLIAQYTGSWILETGKVLAPAKIAELRAREKAEKIAAREKELNEKANIIEPNHSGPSDTSVGQP